MLSYQQTVQLIFGAIDEVNQQLRKDQRIKKSEETVLFGTSERVDSLALINLVVEIEQRLEDACNISISLMDDHLLSQEINPFETVATLATYISDQTVTSSHNT